MYTHKTITIKLANKHEFIHEVYVLSIYRYEIKEKTLEFGRKFLEPHQIFVGYQASNV
ncbi:hypothetical protein [Flavicella sp.]|uniref:hypothetical protein n=1 Tax=Flavicella sp. TaxID=2957742 RepID=UPI0030178D4C